MYDSKTSKRWLVEKTTAKGKNDKNRNDSNTNNPTLKDQKSKGNDKGVQSTYLKNGY